MFGARSFARLVRVPHTTRAEVVKAAQRRSARPATSGGRDTGLFERETTLGVEESGRKESGIRRSYAPSDHLTRNCLFR